MSAKHGKHRNEKRRKHPAHYVAAGRTSWPNRASLPGAPGASAHPRSRTGVVIAAALALLVTAAVGYTLMNNKKDKPSVPPFAANPSPTAPRPPASTAKATSAASQPGPRIQFASKVFDFGRAIGDDTVNCLFVFTNVGATRLDLTEVAPGCSCMKLGEWTRSLEPFQSGTIAVRYDSRNFTGPFAKSVFVTCNDPTQPSVMLEIKGFVWRPLEIRPPFAVMDVTPETPSNSTVVHLTSHLDEPLFLSGLAVDNPAFALELTTNQPGREYQLLVKTAAPWPTATQQGRITFQTSSTNLPSTNLSVRANFTPVVTSIPYIVRLPAPPLTSAFPYTVWIRHSGTNPFVASDPTVNAKGVEAQIKEEQPGRQFAVSLNFPAGFEVPAGEKIELSVKSTHPQFPVIHVPVMQPPRAAAAAPGN